MLELESTPDILAELGKKKTAAVHVGFALETENGVKNATKKLHAKNLDLIVLNDPLEPGAGFHGDTNIVTLITADGAQERQPKMSKFALANLILDKVCRIIQSKHHTVAAVV
jgi:phosphopantothenoylcysteine decarboxylase/phosphopantothenate--cysteine ligase